MNASMKMRTILFKDYQEEEGQVRSGWNVSLVHQGTCTFHHQSSRAALATFSMLINSIYLEIEEIRKQYFLCGDLQELNVKLK